MTERIEKALVDSVKNTFSVTLSLDPNLTEQEIQDKSEIFIRSRILIKGVLQGCIFIVLPVSVACGIVSKMLDTELSEDSLDVKDGIGEILNMIIGEVKTSLDSTPYKFEISIPSTVDVDRNAVSQIKMKHGIVKDFVCDEFCFRVILDYVCNYKDDRGTTSEKPPAPQLSAFEKLSMLVEKAQEDQPEKE